MSKSNPAMRTTALALLLVSFPACASRPVDVHRGTEMSAEVSLRRARDMHWRLRVFRDGEQVAEGAVSQLGSTMAVVGDTETPIMGVDSLYRYVPRPNETGRKFAAGGAVLVALAFLPIAAFCPPNDGCIIGVVAAGAGLGTVLGAAIGGALLESEGEWHAYWYR